jgi:anti-sigma regulatory factor (Ser/Thr protein kinase)
MREAMVLTLPPIPDNVPVVRHALRGMLESCGLEASATADVLLAVTEACTNVVVHAYPDSAAEGRTMEIEADWQGDHELTVVVRDRGRGFSPRVDSPGLGLGLPVIAALTHRVELRETHGGGTEVAMDFVLSPTQLPRPAG